MTDLRPYQIPAVKALLNNDRGILKAPCGSGKTVIAAEALRQAVSINTFRGETYPISILWMAGTNELLAQANKTVDLPQSQTEITFATPTGVNLFLLSSVDILVIDECHHGAADSWKRIIQGCKFARRVWGLSATPEREDDRAQDVYDLIGPVIHTIHTSEIQAEGHAVPVQVKFSRRPPDSRITAQVERATGFPTPPATDPEWKRRKYWNKLVKYGIVENHARNQEVVGLIKLCSIFGDSVLVIVATIEHAQNIAALVIRENGHQGIDLIHSKLRKKDRREVLARFRDGNLPCLIACNLADEGLDVPRCNVLIHAAPTRSNRLTKQRAGRVLRSFAGKEGAVIYDFMDSFHFWLAAQSTARKKTYENLGYKVEVVPCETNASPSSTPRPTSPPPSSAIADEGGSAAS